MWYAPHMRARQAQDPVPERGRRGFHVREPTKKRAFSLVHENALRGPSLQRGSTAVDVEFYIINLDSRATLVAAECHSPIVAVVARGLERSTLSKL